MRIHYLLVIVMLSSLSFAGTSETQSSDTRTKITLTTTEKDFVLERMRRMLETLTAIQISLAQESPEKVDDSVMLLLQFSKENHPTGLHQLLPEGFKQMSQVMNQSWKTLANEITDPKVIQKEIVSIMTTCNACHRSYRIE